MRPWEILLRRLLSARSWPIASEVQVRRWIRLWAALRESDERVLRTIMKWPQDRELVIDNLPEKIASAYGDLLFGQDPTWTAADPEDQQLLIDATATWPSDLQAAEETNASEGEVWYRIRTDPALPHPVVTWHSRADVVPLLRGRAVIAAAFVSKLPHPNPQSKEVYRHIEIDDRGVVLNFLFRGRSSALGQRVPLTQHAETADLPEEWNHGVPELLCGRIVNRWGRRPHVGQSIFHGVWTRFLVLNEAATIGRENLRLTAKKRAVVPASALRANTTDPAQLQDRGDGTMVPIVARPRFDAGEDLLVHDPLDVEEGREGAGPFRVLEYSFDAQALIAYQTYEVETVCQRCDLVPQFLGSGDFGSGNTGTALRVRLLPTVNASEGRGRPWDDELPAVSRKVQLVESAPIGAGGLQRDWKNPAGTPAIERTDAFPKDENEEANRLAQLRSADLVSIEQGIIEQHPDWTNDGPDSQVQTELARIRADIAATVPIVTPFAGH